MYRWAPSLGAHRQTALGFTREHSLTRCGLAADWLSRCGKNFRRIQSEIESMRTAQGISTPGKSGKARKAGPKGGRAAPPPISVPELVLWYYSEWKTASGYGTWKASMLSSNIDVCVVCDGGGVLLCCDACPDAYHLTCMDPPMLPSDVPEDEWCVTS